MVRRVGRVRRVGCGMWCGVVLDFVRLLTSLDCDCDGALCPRLVEQPRQLREESVGVVQHLGILLRVCVCDARLSKSLRRERGEDPESRELFRNATFELYESNFGSKLQNPKSFFSLEIL